MRIIVFSDTHGNISAMHKIFKTNAETDVYIFLGDGERELDEMRELYPNRKILNVCGNCDWMSMTVSADIFVADNARVFFTHGNNFDVKGSLIPLYNKAVELNCQIALFGHTHSREYKYLNGVHLLNPGSAGYPRDGKPASYAFVDITDKGIMCAHRNL